MIRRGWHATRRDADGDRQPAPRAELLLHAYAQDCLVTGLIEVADERLTDVLGARPAIELRDAELIALDDERALQLPSIVIPREELLVVAATGPRGSAARRVRTSPHPVIVGVGPYVVAGCVHALPAADPVQAALRRALIPVTDATIRRESPAGMVEDCWEAVIVNRQHVSWLQSTEDPRWALARASGFVARPGRLSAR